MNLEGVLYIFLIPLLTFFIDFGMRYLTRTGGTELEHWCYGMDLGLTGLSTGMASYSMMKHRHDELVSGVMVLSLCCLIGAMMIHKRFEPLLGATQKSTRVFAKIALALGGNVIGCLGMVSVLWLMWKPS